MFRRHPRRAVAAVLLALAAALLTAGCAAVPPPSGGSASHVVVTPAPTSAAANAGVTTVAPPSAPAATTVPTTSAMRAAPALTSPATAPYAAASGTPALSPLPSRSACRDAELTVSVQRGSAAPGFEFAQLTFTNTGPRTCSVTGFPGVELMQAGKVVGRPAARLGHPRTARLRPGGSTSAMLWDNTRCNAPLADTVAVYPPDGFVQQLRPVVLRACTLSVNSVQAG